jgi:hypothetical protein
MPNGAASGDAGSSFAPRFERTRLLIDHGIHEKSPTTGQAQRTTYAVDQDLVTVSATGSAL